MIRTSVNIDRTKCFSLQAEKFPSGELFLTICENIYNAFTTRRRDIIASTTCPCRACSNVKNLDLKILAHHGSFEEMKFGSMTDISGADVILVHRMAKTDVKAATGVRSYALFSEAAAEAMDADAVLTPYTQQIEHFGDVYLKDYDLGAAWEKSHSARKRFFLEEADGVWTCRRCLEIPVALLWEALTAPELKQRWMTNRKSVSVQRPEGRIGIGSEYHCAHEAAGFLYWVTDWEPFEYFSTGINDPAREGISMPETYHLTATKNGTALRYTIGPAHDCNGNRSVALEAEAVGFLSAFWPPCFDELEKLINQ